MDSDLDSTSLVLKKNHELRIKDPVLTESHCEPGDGTGSFLVDNHVKRDILLLLDFNLILFIYVCMCMCTCL